MPLPWGSMLHSSTARKRSLAPTAATNQQHFSTAEDIMKTKTSINAGGLTSNHNQKTLAVRSSVKAGGLSSNHNQKALAVRSSLNAGGLASNHNQKGIVVRSSVKAGGLNSNHNESKG